MAIKIYIINNEVEFWPDKKLLRRVDSPGAYCILNTPASKCFELILEKRGLVRHEELYAYAWDKEAFEPSPNTLYQNMSILRRGLRKVGNNPNIIVTVARKGFKLKDSTDIVISEANIKEQLSVMDGLDSVESKATVDKKSFFNRSLILPAVFVLIIFSLAAFNYSDNYSDRDALYNYEFMYQNDKCKLYGNKESIGMVESGLKASDLDCNDYPYNYITRFEFTSNYSVISCNYPLSGKNEKTTCKAVYFRDYKDE